MAFGASLHYDFFPFSFDIAGIGICCSFFIVSIKFVGQDSSSAAAERGNSEASINQENSRYRGHRVSRAPELQHLPPRLPSNVRANIRDNSPRFLRVLQRGVAAAAQSNPNLLRRCAAWRLSNDSAISALPLHSILPTALRAHTAAELPKRSKRLQHNPVSPNSSPSLLRLQTNQRQKHLPCHRSRPNRHS